MFWMHAAKLIFDSREWPQWSLSNIVSVLGSIADNSSDFEESDDESDSFDGLEVIEEMSTGKAQDSTSEENNANPNITVRPLLTVLKAPNQERKVAANPPTGKWKYKSSATNKRLAGIKPLHRNKVFPNKILVISTGSYSVNHVERK